jgi:hypothetical protein
MVCAYYTKGKVYDKMSAGQRLPNLGLLHLQRGFGNPLGSVLPKSGKKGRQGRERENRARKDDRDFNL